MFSKIWKTVKFLIIIAIVIICLPHSILPRQTSGFEQKDLEYYLKLNDNETRLIEVKDSEESLKLKLLQLEVINNSRKKFRAEPVKLDILSSRVANMISREAAENSFLGHWNLAGEKPYQRYAFAGGYDHISENAFGEWSSDNYIISGSKISSLMRSGHGTFMDEKAPYDGHKKNIIEKSHNYVGIGYCLKGNQFRYYEEFVDRYFVFENIPADVKVDETFRITVKPESEKFLYYLIVYREDYPQPIAAGQISKKGSYDDFSNEQYFKMAAWELASYRNGSSYKIPLRFSVEGLYYIQIFYDKKEVSEPSYVNTRGKTPGSGIVIRATK